MVRSWLPNLLCIVGTGAVACAQAPDARPDPPTSKADAVSTETLARVRTDIHRLGDWTQQAKIYKSYIDRVWEKNDWSSEPDLYAKRVAHAVTDVPPWQFGDRVRTIADMVSERYRFTPEQRRRFETKLMREAIGFMASNAQVILKHAAEFVSTRLAQKPLTPEQIARMTKESDALVADGMKRADEMMAAMLPMLNAEQRRLLGRDYQSFDRRMNDIIKQRARWADGEWKPADWGMQDDPIQTGAAARRRARPEPPAKAKRARHQADPAERPAAGAPVMPPDPFALQRDGVLVDPLGRDLRARIGAIAQALPYDETTWARFVRMFIKRHALDAGQREAIWSIHAELLARARRYRERHADALSNVPAAERATDERLEPIRSMFDELSSRAAALLTEVQRAASDHASSDHASSDHASSDHAASDASDGAASDASDGAASDASDGAASDDN